MGILVSQSDVLKVVFSPVDPLEVDRYIDANEALLARLAGEHAPTNVVEVQVHNQPFDRVVTTRPVASMTSITVDGVPLDLSGAAFAGRVVYLNYFSARGVVKITYTPVDDTELRRSIVLRMTLIDLANKGYETAVYGDVRENPAPYAAKLALARELGYTLGVA